MRSIPIDEMSMARLRVELQSAWNANALLISRAMTTDSQNIALNADYERACRCLSHIIAKCGDYDGYETIDGLKTLVDTIKQIAVDIEPI